MRFLVTGSRGFAAGHLTEKLLERKDAFVVGVDCLYGCASRHDPHNATTENYVFVKGDVNDADLISHLLKTHQFDIIIHTAAQSHVDTSFSSVEQYARDNFLATLTLLNCVKAMHPAARPKIIHFSTDEVLGPSLDGIAKHEDSLLLGSNVYAATKAASECLVHAFKKSHGLEIIIVRPNNLMAERQYGEKCIPRFVELLKRDLPITIHGSGQQRRAFLAISDLISAIELLLEKGVWGEIYHISSDDEITILQLAKEIATIMGKADTYKIRYCEDRLFNDIRYHIQCDPLKKLGWRQKVIFNDALKQTVQWYMDGKDKDYFVEEFELPVLKDAGFMTEQYEKNPSKRAKILH